MPSLNYKIEDNHFIVKMKTSTRYYYIGDMDGVTAEVIEYGTYPKGHVDLKIIFPDVGPVTFPIYYRTIAQFSVAKYRANEVIEELRNHIKGREVKAALDTVKVIESALLAQLKK